MPFPTQEMLAATLAALHASYIIETWQKQKKNLAAKYVGIVREININARRKILSTDIKFHNENVSKFSSLY